jgi:Flp pilus assembly protein TadD
VYATLQDYQQALADFDQALRLDPTHARAHYHRGRALQHFGRQAEAHHAFQQAESLGY